MGMECSFMLLAVIIIGPILYIIFGLFCKVKEFIFNPIIKSRTFEDLETQDRFTRVKKGSEEHKFLTEALNVMLSQHNSKKKISLKKAVFQKEDYGYYVCDVVLSKADSNNSEESSHYICLLIDACLNISDTLVISKKRYTPLSKDPGTAFENNYTYTSSNSKISEELLFPEVKELFEKFSGRYPMSDTDSNAYTASIGRSVLISNMGITILGNPDATRYNIAEMLDLGKKLLLLMKTVTDKGEIN